METKLVSPKSRSAKAKIQSGSLILGVVVGAVAVTAFYAGRQSASSGPANSNFSSGAISGGSESNSSFGATVGSSNVAGGSASAISNLGPNVVADIAAEAGKWTVNIDTTNVIQVQAPATLEFFSPFGPMEVEQPGRVLKERGTGSGVIVQPDGYILTNNHVVGNADSIKVTLADKRVFDGHVVGRDRYTDLAVVKIDAKGLPSAKIGSTKGLRPGDWAIAIGSPMGLDHSVTLGIISALGRPIFEVSERGQLIQTDAAINPGNSGGPLLNIRGEVIGINAAISGKGQNIGFAIPAEVFQDVMQQLLANGKVKRPWVGVQMQELTPELAQQLGSPGATGVIVANVTEASPADAAGLVPGDIIKCVDDKITNSGQEVRAALRLHKVGDKMGLTILRKGKAMKLLVTIGDFDAESAR
jgi:serine protease Do